MAKKPGGRSNSRSRSRSTRERARSFAFEGLPEKDRFGIFDPALRGFYALGVMFAVVFGVEWVLEGTRGGSAGVAGGVVIAGALVAAGVLGYRRIWRKPSEREMLLAMAKEDAESRAARARAAKVRGERRERPSAPDGERSHE